MLSSMLSSALVLALLTPSVAAHGYLRRVAVDGTFYRGNDPTKSSAVNEPSPIRLIDNIEPLHFANNTQLTCGNHAQPAALVAPALPGSNITFDWASGDDTDWPHNTGPLMTYMALCGNTTCDKFDHKDAQWFKIDEVGKMPTKSQWFQAFIFSGFTHTVGLPTDIKPGDYLIRHEIIALHNGIDFGGAEFYPSCSQLRIGGNGTAVPGTKDLVQLPGAYHDNDAGIFSGTFYDNSEYTFPGPQIAQGLGASSSAITAPSNSTASGRKPLTAVPNNAAASNSTSASNATSPASTSSNTTAPASAASNTTTSVAESSASIVATTASASSDAETSASASSVATAASSASADADASSCSASGASSVPSASASASDTATSASAPTATSAVSSSASAQEDTSYVRRHHARDFIIPADAWAADDDDAPDMPSLLW